MFKLLLTTLHRYIYEFNNKKNVSNLQEAVVKHFRVLSWRYIVVRPAGPTVARPRSDKAARFASRW